MGVVDLSVRLTQDWDSYHKNLCSSDSAVYISPLPPLDDGPASVDLNVGDRCYRQNEDRYFQIGDDGVTLAAYQSLLIETAETVAVPYNVFGLVTGKGRHIFRGAFVSTGKINPGFHSKLRIGIYNGSNGPLVLKKGESLCSCVFLEMESSIPAPLKNYDDSALPVTYLLSLTQKAQLWLRRNREYLSIIVPMLALVVSIVAVLVAIVMGRK